MVRAPAGRFACGWSVVAPLGALLLLLGCVGNEVDGTWRHPVSDAPVSGPAYEFSLGQYGPEVAGLVRMFQPATAGGDVYARPVYCTALADGEVAGDTLRFRFQDLDGVGLSASLEVGEDQLLGTVVEDDGPLHLMKFERVQSGVDKDCEGRTETLALHGIVHGDDPSPSLRVALVYTGLDAAGRFWLPRKVVALDAGAPSFALEVGSFPDPRVLSVAPSDGSLRFGYGVFLAFEDRDDDGRWDRGILGGDSEPVLGVAPDHALAYLEGRASAVYPERPELLEQLNQNYSLVRVERDPDTGEVANLVPADPATESVRVQVPAQPSAIPFLEAD